MTAPLQDDVTSPAPWQVLERQEVYHNPWTTVIEDRLQGPSGEAGLYGYLAPVDCAMVVPLSGDGVDTRVHLVRQWRHAFATHTWELPCGRLDPDESPITAAQRELAEECGLLSDHWQSLGRWLHSDARVSGHLHVFVARHCQPQDEMVCADASEVDLRAQAFPWAQALQAVLDNQLGQVATVAALLRAQALLNLP